MGENFVPCVPENMAKEFELGTDKEESIRSKDLGCRSKIEDVRVTLEACNIVSEQRFFNLRLARDVISGALLYIRDNFESVDKKTWLQEFIVKAIDLVSAMI